MKRTVPMFSAGLTLLPILLLAQPFCSFAQDVQGKVEATATLGRNNNVAQRVASSVTSQQLVRSAKAAGVYEGKDLPTVDWHINGAVSTQGGKRIIFAAFPVAHSLREGNPIYFMSLDVASKKLVALPIHYVVGTGARIVSSPQCNKAVAYVEKDKTSEVFVIDKLSLEPIQLIPDYAPRNFSVDAVRFNPTGTFQITISMPPRFLSGSHVSAKTVVTPAMLPTESQLKQVILANQKQLKPYANKIKIINMGVQKNWARCYIEVPGLDTAAVVFKYDGHWKFVSLGTSFVDPPEGMPADLLD